MLAKKLKKLGLLPRSHVAFDRVGDQIPLHHVRVPNIQHHQTNEECHLLFPLIRQRIFIRSPKFACIRVVSCLRRMIQIKVVIQNLNCWVRQHSQLERVVVPNHRNDQQKDGKVVIRKELPWRVVPRYVASDCELQLNACGDLE